MRLSSTCRCGPGGRPKHEVGQCPHLRHNCTAACGPYYSKYVREPAVEKNEKFGERYGNTTVQPLKNFIVTGEQKFKPPWEK